MNIRTERAIKAWLSLPKAQRAARIDLTGVATILLCHKDGDVIARFSVASIVKKRLPKRKKVVR